MPQTIALTTIVVADYDAAIAFYRDKIGFELREDTDLGGGKRWVVVAPAGASGGMLLARGVGERQTARERLRLVRRVARRTISDFREISAFG